MKTPKAFLVAIGALLSSISTSSALRLPHFGRIDTSNQDLVQQVLKQDFTHIVVGGGTCQCISFSVVLVLMFSAKVDLTCIGFVVVAGLAVASRLSEEPTFSVLVIEAGTYQPLTPGVLVPGLAGTTFESDIDWAFRTQPQEKAKGRRVYWPRGKILGGSSALNFMACELII